MDVLGLQETPEQAVQRMDLERRRAASQRNGPTEHPRFGGYLPEESLGDRGLLVPVALEAPLPEFPSFDEFDRRGPPKERDRNKEHHGGRGHK